MGRSIRQNYARAPYLNGLFPEIEAILTDKWTLLVDLDYALVSVMLWWFDLRRPIYYASHLGIEGVKSSRLLNICNHFQTDRYLSGNAAQSYLDVDLFAKKGITIEWQHFDHPIYRQLHGEFIPYMSALDYALNVGPVES